MTRLRKMMLEELERRNYSPRTIECYIREVEDFARYFHCPPDRLGPQHIREYQAYLFSQRKLAPSSVTQRLAALRFFFIKTLKRHWSVAETPYPKQGRHLPTVLSQKEVARLINAAPTPFYRILLMTLYATGARRAELARLKVSDIDSQRMVVHIQGASRGLSSSPDRAHVQRSAGCVMPGRFRVNCYANRTCVLCPCGFAASSIRKRSAVHLRFATRASRWLNTSCLRACSASSITNDPGSCPTRAAISCHTCETGDFLGGFFPNFMKSATS